MGITRANKKIATVALALCLTGSTAEERRQICESNPMYISERAGSSDPSEDRSYLESGTLVSPIESEGRIVELVDCQDTSSESTYVTSTDALSSEPVPPPAPEAPLLPASSHPAQMGQDGQDCVTMDPAEYIAPQRAPTPPPVEPPVAEPEPSTASPPATGDAALDPPTAARPVPAVPTDTHSPAVAPLSPGSRAIARRRVQFTGTSAAGPADPNPPFAQDNIGLIQDAVEASDQARGVELVESALTRLKTVREAAGSDRETLSQFHNSATMENAVGLLDRARGKLERAANFLTEGEFAGAGAAETGRFRNAFLNARDRAESGARVLGEDLQKKAIRAQSPFLSLFGQHLDTSDKTNSNLTEIFGATSGLDSDTSQDALVNRMILFNSLSDSQQRSALDRLKLAETKKVVLKNGQTVVLPLLHNGYFFGGGDSAVDCSSFVSRVLPAEVRRGSFTTLDFRMMWLYARSGQFQRPPAYHDDRKKLVMKTAEAFTPIDLYLGDGLQVGDLLVYRLPWKAAGHVFIVKDFDRTQLKAKVIEASQSAGTIRERDFQLSVDHPSKRKRRIRPGLFVLRLKPVSTRVCEYQGSSKSTARSPAPRGGSKLKMGEGAAF